MKLVSNFNRALSIWFARHGISNLEFTEGEEFCYYPEAHAVQWGMLLNDEQENMYAQFMYEYGLEREVNPFVISLLHEVGHFMTIHQLGEETVQFDYVAKEIAAGAATEVDINSHYWYWELDTEFAANMWAIEWVKNHPAELQELNDLCEKHCEVIFCNAEIMAQIVMWQLNMEFGGEYYPLTIDEEEE